MLVEVTCYAHRCFGDVCPVQTITDDLSASLAEADELSREFNSMLKEASPSSNNNNATSQVHADTRLPPPPPVSSSVRGHSIPVHFV